MTTAVVEKRQSLTFDASWQVVKWDMADEYVSGIQRALMHGGVKATDVVGIRAVPRRPRTILVAEFKDFANPNIPPADRQRVALAGVSDKLLHDIGRKVIDTLAGATFAHDDTNARHPDLDKWRPSVGRSTTTLLVLVCVELPPTQAVAALAWTKRLQQRLRWLGPQARVVVTSSARPFSGIGIVYSA